MKSEHKKKMIAPIVVTVIMAAYYFLYFGWIAHVIGGIGGRLLGIVPILLAALMIYVCVQRIHEIKEGEEDDLSQY